MPTGRTCQGSGAAPLHVQGRTRRRGRAEATIKGLMRGETPVERGSVSGHLRFVSLEPRVIPSRTADALGGGLGFVARLGIGSIALALRDQTESMSGTASVVDSAAFEATHAKVKAKYGYQLGIIDVLHALPGSLFFSDS